MYPLCICKKESLMFFFQVVLKIILNIYNIITIVQINNILLISNSEYITMQDKGSKNNEFKSY